MPWLLTSSQETARECEAGDVEASTTADVKEFMTPETWTAAETITITAVAFMEVVVSEMGETVNINNILRSRSTPSSRYNTSLRSCNGRSSYLSCNSSSRFCSSSRTRSSHGINTAGDGTHRSVRDTANLTISEPVASH